MRKILTMVFCFIICTFILVGCDSTKTDKTSINIAKEAVVAFYEKKFIMVPVECIEYMGYDNELKELEFFVAYNPKKFYPDLFDKDDEVEIIEDTLYIKQEDDVFTLYDEDKEMVFSYYNKTGR